MATSRTVIRLWAIMSLILLLFVLNVANAQTVVVGNPTIGGSGCPEGTVSATLSPDGTAISILFDEFSIDAPANTARSDIRKSCRFIIPVQVPQGFVLQNIGVEYRGFVSASPRAIASVSTSNLFSNPRFGAPPKQTTKFQGGTQRIEQGFLISHKSNQSRGNKCYAQNQIDFTTEISVGPTRSRFMFIPQEDSVLSVDSADLAAGEGPIQVAFQVVPCR